MVNKTVSMMPSGTNNYLSPPEQANRTNTDFLSPGVSGVITSTSGVAPTTGSFAVNAQGTPNMTVAVSAGKGLVNATPSGGNAQNYNVKADATENVTIANNATGSTVFDFLYITLDATKLNNPATAGTDVFTYTVSRSTTAYSATGANNGNSNGTPANSFLLSVMTVATGAVSIANASITDARIAGVISSPAYQAGVSIQTVATNSGTSTTTTSIIPIDDTIPQITEGLEVMTQAITPKSATNRLLVECTVTMSTSNANYNVAALFQDATANALAASVEYNGSSTGQVSLTIRHDMLAGTTASTTFRLRIGPGTAGTTTFNGAAAVRNFGGITLSNIKITEYKA